MAFLCTSYSNAQEITTTNNIVIPTTNSSGATWTGAVYQDNLTCWSGGDPGYCGPNAIVRPGDNINFSYGSTYIYQQQHISSVLPAGSGLQVNGYNFSFNAKNGSGWDDGRTDSLTALVRFWDNTGGRGASNLLYGKTYDLNYKFDWTYFNYSETFNKALAAPQIGQLQYGFIGRDNNGWSGPYGPEIYNVNFSVKYSVDPCATNKLYSPSCPGYLDALAKLAPAPVITTTAVEYNQPPPPAAEAPAPPGSQPPPSSLPAMGSPMLAGSGPAPSSTIAATTPAATAQQERSASGPGPGLGFALNLIAKNSDREKAIAQQAVSTSIAEAQAAGDKAQAVSISTATAAVVTSTTSADTVTSSTSVQTTGSSSQASVASNIATQNSSGGLLQNTQSFTSTVNSSQVANVQLQAPTSIEILQNSQNYGAFETQVQKAQEPELPPQAVNFISDRNSPLREIITPTLVQQAQSEQQSTTVNRNSQPNEAAVGVALEKMATIPQGYASYTNVALQDASFYDSKPIYTNQRVIDNVRVLRGLGNDQKHQDLVNLQYR